MNNDLDVLLINAPSPLPGSILSHRIQGLPPLGLGYIGTWLIKNNYTAKILDFYIKEVTILDLEKIIKSNSPKLIGISTTTETYKSGLAIAKYIKSLNSEIIVFMGGCHVTFEYEDTLKSGFIDLVVRHEGELIVKDLCDYYINNIGSLHNIEGISYIDNGIIKKNPRKKFIEDLDMIPFPDRKLYDLNKYAVPASISTSRGCPGKCIFCAATALSGGRYRVRSAENVLEEFKYLKSLGSTHIQIVDDTMTADVERLYKLLELLKKENLGITWNCESRVDIMSKDLLKEMKDCGCTSVQFGVETGSQEMLDCLKKNITIDQIRKTFLWARELDISTATCLMIGQPYDTIETINKSVELALELQSYGAKVVFSVSTPFPGTFMYNNPDKVGIKIKDFDTDNYNTLTPVYDTNNFNREDIQILYYDALIRLSKGDIRPESKILYKNISKYLKEQVAELTCE
ncbi:B12-binding domain-containing radical SAM protein [Clostridium sp. JS66]|uniref:B12-binding domain-containing radical SAM protein n=1 Tax=Clostridium sp. JS66 TaxID=3064705 RepID=UPI00298E647F|nr:radical SAM protein [Clostridium sp. JS66]WPC42608.1 radical SAM protein [Clostridium sp. JS66]